MLDAHPVMAIPPETWFLFRVLRLRAAGPEQRARLFEAITGLPTWDDAGLSRDTFRRTLDALEPFDVAEGVRGFYRLYAARHGKQRWGDKTPGYLSLLDGIARLLPEAHFVHVVRDGRDVALSLRGLWFAPAHDVPTLAAFWGEQIRTARRLGRSRSYLEVRYEDLVREPRAQLQRVAAFVGLAYDRAMECYFESARERLNELKSRVGGHGFVQLSRAQRLAALRLTSEPPHPSRIGRWRREMSREERVAFERTAGDLLQELGYETSVPG